MRKLLLILALLLGSFSTSIQANTAPYVYTHPYLYVKNYPFVYVYYYDGMNWILISIYVIG